MSLSLEDGFAGVATLGELLPGVPKTPKGVEILAKEFTRLADSPEKLEWLIETAVRSWEKFEGIRELRAMYCHRYRPADGQSVQGSNLYPETGYSREQLGLPPRQPAALLPAPRDPERVSLDPALDQIVRRTTAVRSMDNLPQLSPEERKRAREFEEVLREIETPPAERKPVAVARKAPQQIEEPLPEGSYRRITQADIEEAVRQLHEKKGTE